MITLSVTFGSVICLDDVMDVIFCLGDNMAVMIWLDDFVRDIWINWLEDYIWWCYHLGA